MKLPEPCSLKNGAAARLVFHGVKPLPEGRHPQLGELRYNLTFRRAG